jgi:hypothetical protein
MLHRSFSLGHCVDGREITPRVQSPQDQQS